MASHRRPPSPGPRRAALRATVLSATAASAVAGLAAVPATAEPRDPAAGAAAARRTVDRLHAEAERATEAYNAAGERRARLRREADRVRERVAREQERVNRMRDGLGALAGAQYRAGGIEPGVALLLTTDPDGYLAKAAALERIGDRRAAGLRALRTALRSLRQQRAEATGTLAELAESQAAVARHKATVQRRLAAARQVLGRLSTAERAALDRSWDPGGPGPGHPPGAVGTSAASARGAAALLAARQAVGAPYAWGQAGPTAFDCSGLTQWAYGRAGVAIPRTSQAQRLAGRTVPLSQARPGDLVVYRSDASHVAMYAGGGQVIHAPYPGARVRYDPVGMMPIASVTRP
ncbi:C40 family peptidase [Streptomyces pactum]|uniref:C40 family peptidase n=1 Tax=Streptomyces pactum TaxID=68249 RepID=A0ABS0NH08_9ACTN|nr:C40 family peptidase [Streptomyces pactum]MBH5334443.1 C40 family peptidase [Streptomyces pactum]